jgi:hypothetical protein
MKNDPVQIGSCAVLAGGWRGAGFDDAGGFEVVSGPAFAFPAGKGVSATKGRSEDNPFSRTI